MAPIVPIVPIVRIIHILLSSVSNETVRITATAAALIIHHLLNGRRWSTRAGDRIVALEAYRCCHHLRRGADSVPAINVTILLPVIIIIIITTTTALSP